MRISGALGNRRRDDVNSADLEGRVAMGASLKPAGGGGRRRGRRHGGAHTGAMSEINVTPFVDVMLVLLIIFMVAAPLLQVGVPIELPKTQGQQLQPDQKQSEPLAISVQKNGDVYIGETKVALEEVAAKLKAIAKNGANEQIYVRGDEGVSYGVVMKVMGRISAGGFTKVSLVTESETGS